MPKKEERASKLVKHLHDEAGLLISYKVFESVFSVKSYKTNNKLQDKFKECRNPLKPLYQTT